MSAESVTRAATKSGYTPKPWSETGKGDVQGDSFQATDRVGAVNLFIYKGKLFRMRRTVEKLGTKTQNPRSLSSAALREAGQWRKRLGPSSSEKIDAARYQLFWKGQGCTAILEIANGFGPDSTMLITFEDTATAAQVSEILGKSNP